MDQSIAKKVFVLLLIFTCLFACVGCSSKFVCTGCGQERTGKKFESSYTLHDEKIVLCQQCYEGLQGLLGN